MEKKKISKNDPLVKEKIAEPNLYMVIFHNDDVTTMDFVIEVLMSIFYMSREQAYEKMMEVHTKGRAIVGVYPREIAMTKRERTLTLASDNGFPLNVTCERSVCN